jgi:hypothetical protein
MGRQPVYVNILPSKKMTPLYLSGVFHTVRLSSMAHRRWSNYFLSILKNPVNPVQNLYTFVTGNRRTNRAPPSGRFSAVRVPPCASASLRAIANPSPEPPSARALPESSR